jgi:hypothetical protein
VTISSSETNGTTVPAGGGGGTGDVVGPASSVNNRVALFSGATGKVIKDSGLTLAGTNTGDQTSIVGITGTLAEFNAALTGADFATGGGTVTGTSSGTNTGDQTAVTGNAGTATALQTARSIDGQAFNGTADITVVAPATVAATGKTTLVDADVMPLADSAAANVLKKVTWANLKATLKTYFDTLYQAAGSYLTSGGALGTPSSGSLTNCTGLPQAGVTNLTTDLAAKQATLVSGTNIKTINGASILGSGDLPVSGSGGASLVSAFLTSTQANSTVTPAVLTGHTFTLTPGQSLILNGQVVCTSAALTTGFAIGLRVAQQSGAGGNVVGSAMAQVAIANAAGATQLYDADVFNVAAAANSFFEVLGTASTAGNNGGSYQLTVKNNGTSGVATITVEFRSEVAASAVTAQIGTGCVGVKG